MKKVFIECSFAALVALHKFSEENNEDLCIEPICTISTNSEGVSWYLCKIFWKPDAFTETLQEIFDSIEALGNDQRKHYILS